VLCFVASGPDLKTTPSRGFECEDVDATTLITRKNGIVLSKRATLYRSVAGKRRDHRAALEVPDLESMVLGSGDGAATVRRRRHGVTATA
jgi:hypothetical protein